MWIVRLALRRPYTFVVAAWSDESCRHRRRNNQWLENCRTTGTDSQGQLVGNLWRSGAKRAGKSGVRRQSTTQSCRCPLGRSARPDGCDASRSFPEYFSLRLIYSSTRFAECSVEHDRHCFGEERNVQRFLCAPESRLRG